MITSSCQLTPVTTPYLAVLDQLTLGGKVYGAVDHPPDPHHGVGVSGGRQDGLQGAAELLPSLAVVQVLARLGDGAQEELVPRQSLDGFDQHGVYPQVQVVAELVLREELDVLVDYDGAPAVVDAVPPVLSGQSGLLSLEQLPGRSIFTRAV